MEPIIIQSRNIKPITKREYRDQGDHYITVLVFNQLPDYMVPLQITDLVDIITEDGICRVIVIQVDFLDVMAVVWKG